MKLKIILGILGVLVVLLVVLVLVAGAHLGALVKAGMEKVGPKVTQTTLTVDSVDVSIPGGTAAINGLVLGNPQGYEAAQCISLGKASISLVPGSIMSDKIVIRSIEVRALEITFEGNPLGANNLSQLMANVDATSGATGSATNAAAQKSGKKLEVDDLLITGAKIHAKLTGLIQQEITLPLPDIHLTGLGTGPGGITAADLTKQVLAEITTGTIQAVASSVTNLGKDAAGAAKGILKNAAGGVLQNSNVLGQGVDKLKKGLDGLLGK